jgi:hypothetical protein
VGGCGVPATPARRYETSPPQAARFGLVFYIDEFDLPRSDPVRPDSGMTINEIFDSEPLYELTGKVDAVSRGDRAEHEEHINYTTLHVSPQHFQVLVRYPNMRHPAVELEGPLAELRQLLDEWNAFCEQHPAPDDG